ncbi:MAG TPA: hypothetical protein VFT37_10960 [Telluria sp.]|nr:hypothetical protein [Telluria sp.]
MFMRTLLLAGCLLATPAVLAEPLPVPAEKMAYVGEWVGKDMRLNIAKNGQIDYKVKKPNKKVDMSIELVRFEGNNFDAGYGIVTTTFVVSKPPHKVGDKWKMVVDGVELTKR